ncbi:MAG: polyribonucleotide nucleotidyltransferase [Candidatus Peregrinibacteria bacterium]|nr:polyribonucleotide nucleotidyltransferase [Candidatus Peregrinibacteria bacterium]
MQKSLTCDLAGRQFKLETGHFVTQAGGSITAWLGDTVVMANASMSDDPKAGAEFFPMVVDYEERYYAAGKIKGSRFIKREGRPSENAVLNSRVIDRPIRPLFPKGLTHDVQLLCTVLSADLEVDPSTTAINAASMALLASGAPFEGPVGAVRIGYIEENGAWKLIVNPTYTQASEGRLNIVVAGTLDAITMVESESSELDEDTMIKALALAHEEIKKLCTFQLEFAKQLDIKPKEYKLLEPSAEMVAAVEGFVTKDMLDAIKGATKKEVKKAYKALLTSVLEKFATEVEAGTFTKPHLDEKLNKMVEKNMRANIMEKELRIDGRKLDQIRALSAEVGVLPRTHGTGLFTRGETQILSIATLGAPGDSQVIDTMDTDIEKRYIHHYNFPPYAVGEIKMLRSPSRREIGHGDLAERALLPVLPSKEVSPYTIWVVSETLSCNGSSSMGSVCGSSLALMDAGVQIKRHVAGIAMGMVTDGKGGYKILTDIQGMEDFAGDMDFKVTGSREGITALQMDIKVKGLNLDIMREALERAKKARFELLDMMEKVIAEPRKEMSKYAPMITTVKIDVEQIRSIIGKGGETIQKITAECGVEIDIDQSGLVFITAPTQEAGKKAVDWVKSIVYVPEAGEVFDGTVTRLMEFGAFVEIAPGKEGLVHISQLSGDRVDRVEDVVNVGDKLKVKLMEIDDQGRYNLSHKATLPGFEDLKLEKRPPARGGFGGGRPPFRR